MKRWLIGAALALASCWAAAQYPDRPLRIVVPLPPGGSPDTIARTLASHLQETWKQPVVVENRTGGSQNIGSDAVAKSSPDGYTWLLAPDNVFVTNPYIAKATTFDPLTDLLPVTEVARIQFLLVVPSSLPVNSVQELVAYAKAHPGELNFGSSGNGSPQHLSAALLQLLAGIQMNHVPYKGAAPAVTDLLPGRIQVWIGAANSLLPHIREGKLKLLGSTAPQRFANLGDTPAIGETLSGYSVDPWLGLFMPSKVPADVVKKVNAEVARILGSAEIKAKLAPQGIEVLTNSPEDFARLIREDYAKWGKVIKEANIRGE
ncbi:MAG: tripartite tricarboxylate transporter substrate binding protein [Betaproteobacteria bacterium]|nr:tripartite tricarboxylate transporter substrate binding protein [Betaproteobacteria bacterium]